ncbi:MAG: hypothetical protein JKY49_18450 [Cohaesibacteraceae bacterium]|nr:hypothetical protein [Cohaesibacteraceae bacterium]
MTTNTNNPPIETLRDGAVSAKIWRNITKKGNPAYSVTFQRTYTDPATKQISESRSFRGTDILKVPQLASEAYRSIGKMRQMDRDLASQHDKSPTQDTDQCQLGLSQQRDAAMETAAPAQQPPTDQTPVYER